MTAFLRITAVNPEWQVVRQIASGAYNRQVEVDPTASYSHDEAWSHSQKNGKSRLRRSGWSQFSIHRHGINPLIEHIGPQVVDGL